MPSRAFCEDSSKLVMCIHVGPFWIRLCTIKSLCQICFREALQALQPGPRQHHWVEPVVRRRQRWLEIQKRLVTGNPHIPNLKGWSKWYLPPVWGWQARHPLAWCGVHDKLVWEQWGGFANGIWEHHSVSFQQQKDFKSLQLLFGQFDWTSTWSNICTYTMLIFDTIGFGQPRLRQLKGWNVHMETADILHVLWCGIARDLSGSVLLDAAEWCGHQALDGAGWDERLRFLHTLAVNWCANNGIRPSTLEDFSGLIPIVSSIHIWCLESRDLFQHVHYISQPMLGQGLQKLSVDAMQYDFPLGPSKAYSNRVMSLGFPSTDAVLFTRVCSHLSSRKLSPLTLNHHARLAWLADFILQVSCPHVYQFCLSLSCVSWERVNSWCCLVQFYCI